MLSLATGLPASFLRTAGCRRREPDRAPPPPGPTKNARFLILAMSRHGHPINANAPGSYESASIVHPIVPEAQPVPFTLAGAFVIGARAWSAMPQAVLDRTCFFHGRTGTLVHLDLPKVASLMGASRDDEAMASSFSTALAPALETVLRTPVSLLGESGFEEQRVMCRGRKLPNHDALAIRDILLDDHGSLAALRHLRDRAMDRLHARLSASGTPEEKAFVDGIAQSSREARDLGERLLGDLSGLSRGDADAQIVVATALIKLKVTPVVVIDIPFGGDNHSDPDLVGESTQLVSGVRRITTLMARLTELGLQDDTTYMSLNPFGRTLRALGTAGRNHLDHHVSIIIGKGIQGGVVGGIAATGDGEFAPLGIDSSTGRASETAFDIAPEDTLPSLAKTVGANLGIARAQLDAAITRGKAVPAALVG